MAAKFGVDVGKLIVLQPDYGEQAVDLVDAFLQAEDSNLIMVDSLAALIPMKEQESTSERMQVGGNSHLVGNMMRKCVSGMQREKKKDHFPTILLVNQLRMKIGVMFGNPETMPGGNSMKFASGLTVRVYGKDVVDEKISKAMPIAKKTSVILKKWKVPIVAINSEYQMTMVAHSGMKPGQVADWNTVSTYLKDMELLAKNGNKGWSLFDDHIFPTLDAVREFIYEDPDREQEVKQLIIDTVLAKTHGDLEYEDEVSEEEDEEA